MREGARNEGEGRTKKKFLSRPNLSSFFDINLHNFTSLAARGSEERRTTSRALCFSVRSSGSSAYLYGRPSWFDMYRVSPWDRSPWLLPGDEYEIYFEARSRVREELEGRKIEPGAYPLQHLKPRWPVSNAKLSVSTILRKSRRPWTAYPQCCVMTRRMAAKEATVTQAIS